MSIGHKLAAHVLAKEAITSHPWAAGGLEHEGWVYGHLQFYVTQQFILKCPKMP